MKKYSKNYYKFVAGCVTAIVCALAFVTCGCESLQDVYDDIRGKSSSGSETSVDAADYAAFNWKFGGFNGSGAALDERVQIELVGISANRITYRWVTPEGLAPWGITDVSAAEALVCAFVKDANGNWVGGKFDWISTNRLFRDFGHLGVNGEGYNGWDVRDFPNPTEMAFVIVGWQGKGGGFRSNVIVGEWKR